MSPHPQSVKSPNVPNFLAGGAALLAALAGLIFTACGTGGARCTLNQLDSALPFGSSENKLMK
jgi:hypothetical protein